jgi:hypothetical protein
VAASEALTAFRWRIPIDDWCRKPRAVRAWMIAVVEEYEAIQYIQLKSQETKDAHST